MASVNLSKVHSTTSGAKLIAHMARYDDREGVEYKNRDIDPARTSLNWRIDDRGESWQEVQQRLRREVEELDKKQPPKRHRSDRVELVTVSIPCPAGIEHDEARLHQFFDMAYRTLAEFCSGYCSPGYIHMDEVHEYRDRDGTLKESRPHMHLAMVPYTPERGVHCKSFMSRQRLIDINRELEERCVKELGIHLQTGQAPGRQTVEELKTESIRAEQAIELVNLNLLRDEARQEEQKAQRAALVESESRKSVVSLESRVEQLEQRLEDMSAGATKQAFLGYVVMSQEEYIALTHADQTYQEMKDATREAREITRTAKQTQQDARSEVGQLKLSLKMERLHRDEEVRQAVQPYREFLEKHGLSEEFRAEQALLRRERSLKDTLSL